MTLLKTVWRLYASLFILLGVLPLGAQDKVFVFTYSYNRPDFIEIQDATLKKFLVDDYEFVVFNDANDPAMKAKIQRTCQKLNLTCIDMPQNLHKVQAPSHRNAAIVNYSLVNYGFSYSGIVALLDSDMFLVKKFSIKDFLVDHPLGGLYQVRSSPTYVADYLWIGIAFLDMNRLPNRTQIDFGLGDVNGVITDTGGFTHYYLRDNRDVPVRFTDQRYTQTAYDILQECGCCDCLCGNFCSASLQRLEEYGDFDEKQVCFVYNTAGGNSEFYLGNHFFHYRAGSNWDKQTNQFHAQKTKCFNDYIHSLLAD